MKKNLLIAGTALLLTAGAVTATVFTNKKPDLAKKENCCLRSQSTACAQKMTAAECAEKKAAGECSPKATLVKAEETPQPAERTHCFD